MCPTPTDKNKEGMSNIQDNLEWCLISGASAPDPISSVAARLVSTVQTGDFETILKAPFAQVLLTPSPPTTSTPAKFNFSASLRAQIDKTLPLRPTGYSEILELLLVGIAALNAFLQSNVTGPPLPFRAEALLLPTLALREQTREITDALIRELAVEGEAVYHLIPDVLLFVLARGVLRHPVLEGLESARWWRLRVNFLHQKLLEEAEVKTQVLYDDIYRDLDYLADKIRAGEIAGGDNWMKARFLIEKAQVDLYFGSEKAAREGLEKAAGFTGLQYALTGLLGKRTKFQERDISQLVVLAKSIQDYTKGAAEGERGGNGAEAVTVEAVKPVTLELNDDTLLESIAFKKPDRISQTTTIVGDLVNLPDVLKQLDPGEQPPLHPLDATILLLLTETIKNNNPASGITREQMSPYAERVLKHSTNWQVYTMGLLVRCRLEAYKSRTTERSLLQLQAVVDQVIAETSVPTETGSTPTTFLPLPRCKEESAPVRERLEYLYQLPVQSRWELEAELAHRWVSMGGIKTALEIYQRLQMWAEVALCWAAIEKQDKARKVIRNQLLQPVPVPDSWISEHSGDEYNPTQEEEAARKPIEPPPTNAPRLWSILGDIDNDPAWYEMSWEVSRHRYSRAKRSLGKYWYGRREFLKSAEALAVSLNIHQLNKESWFFLGCCRLELEDWEGGVDAFRRVTILDDEDAEAWSNLASCLLRRGARVPPSSGRRGNLLIDDTEGDLSNEEREELIDTTRNRQEALKALKKASSLKYDNWRIWENAMIVAASIPSYPDVILAMSRVIEIRGPTAGESCVDVEIISHLIQHVLTSATHAELTKCRPSLAKTTVDFMEKQVIPLITKDARLWRLAARLALARERPKEALECYEKAFRCISRRWEVGEVVWGDMVEATIEMVDSYRSLGEVEREGLVGDGEEKVMVARDWKFKARSVLRKTMGWGRKDGKEGEEGWENLEEAMEGLKR